MLAVAHRGGNTIAGLRAALDAGVDLVEADIHLYRGALEVRHSRAIGPRLYWDRATGVTRRRDVVVPELEEVLAVAGGDPRRMLDAFAGDANVRRILSAANPRQLSRLRARLRGERAHGVSIRLRLLTPAIVAELRRSTDLVLAWSVDTEPELDRSFELGVTGVISKNMTLLSRLAS